MTMPEFNIQKILALLVVGAFIGLVYMTWIRPISGLSGDALRVLDTLTGVLAAWGGQIVQFNFGSTAGSEKTTSALAHVATGGVSSLDRAPVVPPLDASAPASVQERPAKS